ncbi:MAG TPA: hypothetical protein VGE31_02280 [Candidatus Paceibacterota bacterium]
MILVSALAVLGYMLFQIEAKGRQLKEQIKTLNEERGQEDAFYKLQRTAEESAGDRALLGGHFLREESDTIDLLTRIESLAPKMGVVHKIDGLQKVSDKTKTTNWIEISISFSGNEEQVDNFVKMLENLPYLLKITSLNLSAQTSTLWNARVTMRVYVLNYDK